MDELSMWVVYDHPLDWPNHYVARRWTIGETMQATIEIILHRDIEQLRQELMRRGLVRLDRFDWDDPVILETWL